MPRLTPIDAIHECLNNKENFVLQGGAGSGKTETLKGTLAYISQIYPAAKVACITHTNFAVDQIVERVGDEYTISTIHSFLNHLTKDYKKNIHQIIHQLFCLEPIIRTSIDEHEDEKSFKKFEHSQYKGCYDKYSKRLYQLKNESTPKVTGKREYDNDPETYNADINAQIDEINEEIKETILKENFKDIVYNETQFNSLKGLTYGHDGLLKVACFLVDEFKRLRKIFSDKYDYIFIDEYQDTNPEIIDMFINNISTAGTVIGLFGDSVQAIYEDGIGDVNEYIEQGLIKKIDKEDNFRCSEQVISFANQIRYDGLTQEVAFKKGEAIEDRQGNVDLFYALVDKKPDQRSDEIDKQEYLRKLDHTIREAQKGEVQYTALKLTNKSIARDAEFSTLFETFDNRYLKAKDEIEKKLSLWQFQSLFELCDAYHPFSNSDDVIPNYNEVIKRLKNNGFKLTNIADKKRIQDNIQEIISSKEGAFQTIERAFSLGLMKRSESFDAYFSRVKIDLTFYSTDELHKSFKEIYQDGGNTFTRFGSDPRVAAHDEFKRFSEEDFNEKKRDLAKEEFLSRIDNDEVSFQEILNYYRYLNEYLPFITMHKTKGGEIDNVLVVLDEYFWSQYNFQSAFKEDTEQSKKERNANLIYVACTRAKTNLRCVRLIKDEEEEKLFTSLFPSSIKVALP